MSFSTHTHKKSKLDELFVKQVMWGENKRKQRKVDRGENVLLFKQAHKVEYESSASQTERR